MNNIITVWYRQGFEDDKFDFNHISDGWDDDSASPVPVSEMQKRSWKGSKWRKIKAELDSNNNLIVVSLK